MPDRQFVLSTSLQPEEVVDALNRRCEFGAERFRPVAALFEAGSISRERFELRLIGRPDRARVNVHGKIHSAEPGATVAVRVGVTDPFGVIWSAGCLVGALVALLSIRSWSLAPAGLGIAAGAMALFVLHRLLSLKALDDSASTAEMALKDVLTAKTAVEGVGSGSMAPSQILTLNER